MSYLLARKLSKPDCILLIHPLVDTEKLSWLHTVHLWQSSGAMVGQSKCSCLSSDPTPPTQTYEVV